MRDKLVLIDGHSILNRAFYGVPDFTNSEGTHTNAIFGFLNILFKIIDEENPKYLCVAFDVHQPTFRHEMYKEYKGTRKPMLPELKQQVPLMKEMLKALNIKTTELAGFEADDILGTLSKAGEEQGLEVSVISGDRDLLQLATEHVKIRIPKTKKGKTEIEDYNVTQVLEKYSVTPKEFIDVKALMGDSSDNIPGVPGVGEKTALKLIKEYENIDNLYEKLEAGQADDIKGALKTKLENNKDLAMLSRTLGTILRDAPLGVNIEDLRTKEWDKEAVTNKFKELQFNRFIERFDLNGLGTPKKEAKIEDLFTLVELDKNTLKDELSKINDKFIYYIEKEKIEDESAIIKDTFKSLYFYKDKKVFYVKDFELTPEIINIFADEKIDKISYRTKSDYIILKEHDCEYNNIKYDAEIAGYNLNPTDKNNIEEMSKKYLELDMDEYLENEFNGTDEKKSDQMNLFDNLEQKDDKDDERSKYQSALICYAIAKLEKVTTKKLEEVGSLSLFNNIEMPLVPVLAQMQFNGMLVDESELKDFGDTLKGQVETLSHEICDLAGEEFNVNSHQQLGKILFEKLQLPVYKKTKNGYTTDVEVLEKLKGQHPIIEKILEYRTLAKLNSTYVEGLIPYINPKTKRIHSSFHQIITATGRISSTEPNLQNIPTRAELGKQIRKAFKPAEGNIYIDADYSQVELRVLAHISQDENMIHAFNHGEDIHKQAASKVLGIPIEEVTKEQRSSAKAVNFGIVYGISDFGLANQLGVSNKQAKEYISQYLEKYQGIKHFMDDIVESAKAKGYVETLFGRRRYIPEIKSSNYMVRQFGSRVAMNTPIQGTAADIMKIAMINVNKALKENHINGKIVLQIHDELLLEVSQEDKEQAKEILKQCMENAMKLSVPLEVEISEGEDWYEVK